MLRSRFRRLLRVGLRLGAALVLALLLAELAVRVAGLRPPPRSPRADHSLIWNVSEDELPGVGHMLKAGGAVTRVYPGHGDEGDRTVTYVINELGYREDPFPEAKPAGSYRIVMLGDSITYGTGIALEQTMAHQLRPLLAERFPGAQIEVLNCGVPGTNTGQQAAFLRRRVMALEPDMVLLCSTIVDASGYGIHRGPGHEPPEAARWVRALGLTSGLVEAESLPPAVQRTMAVRRVSALADLAAHQAFRHLYGRSLLINYRDCWKPDSPGVRSVRRGLGVIKTLAERRGMRLHVAMFPFLAGLDGDYPFTAEAGRMSNMCTELAVPFTHLLPALQGYRPGQLQAHAHDRHPNGLANALAARYLAEAIAPGIAADLGR
ncbi:MAG: hypothetical protein DRQ55_01305 [Planctomycetota bacterium]|nr:MAG: hypothetical protein DRQ55_01305 [Planctomycetota bacterium]